MPTTGEFANSVQSLIGVTGRKRETAAMARILTPMTLRQNVKSRPILACVIENDIIPKLVKHHHSMDREKNSATVSQGLVEEFTIAALQFDATASRSLFDGFIARCSLEILFEQLLVPAAIRLGEMWDQDLCDFVEVARGMDHIQQIVLTHSGETCTLGYAGSRRRILLAALPGERHRLGLSLIRAELWRNGWDVRTAELATLGELETLARELRVDAVGLSAGRVSDPRAMSRILARVRQSSPNRSLAILVGGYAFNSDPSLCAAVGANAAAANGREAVNALRQLLDGGQSAVA